MKKLLFSTTVLLGAMGICVANFNGTHARPPVQTNNKIVRDTVPSDTTKPTRDSSFLQLK